VAAAAGAVAAARLRGGVEVGAVLLGEGLRGVGWVVEVGVGGAAGGEGAVGVGGVLIAGWGGVAGGGVGLGGWWGVVVCGAVAVAHVCGVRWNMGVR